MSAGEIPESLLEAALHASLARRCERAYVHDLRNGLQSIYASVDVLTRMLGGKTSAILSPEKAAGMARKAIQVYEQSLNEVAKRLIVQSESPRSISVGAALRELCAFLGNDAAARDIQFQATDSADLWIRACPGKFRLTLLSIAVRIMDSMGGGELTVSTREEGETVALSFVARAQGAVVDDAVWRLGRSAPSLQDDWVLYATRILAEQDSGAITSGTDRSVELRYPATLPSS